VWRDLYLSIGGCDEGFGLLAAEDRDFIHRWRVAGYGLTRCGEAMVRHHHRSSLRGFVRQYFNYGRGAFHYHRLRRLRRTGMMSEDVRLHGHLFRYLRRPLARVPPRLRVQVVTLVGLWQAANLAGFAFQGVWGRRGS
jgi:GT2 family glycosyltransferase